MAEELFELKNYFYLGNYANAITEGETVHLDDEQSQMERDVILKRIELAQGKYDAIIGSKNENNSPAIEIIKTLARVYKEEIQKEEIRTKIEELVSNEENVKSPNFIIMCAIGYIYLNDYDNALRTAHKNSNSLEEISIKIQVLIQMDRIDVAEKEHKKMQHIDEDNTLSQLCQAFIHLAYACSKSDKDRLQEALYIYQDLLERHGATDSILNGIAICHIASSKPDEADKVLSEALTKNPNCSTSLINAICSSAYRNKPQLLIQRYFTQLATVNAKNPWLVEYKKKEDEFDQLAQEMAVV